MTRVARHAKSMLNHLRHSGEGPRVCGTARRLGSSQQVSSGSSFGPAVNRAGRPGWGSARSGYCARRERPPSKREMANRELHRKVETVYDKSHGTYGSPRIYRGLKRQSVPYGEDRVACLIRVRGW